MDVEEPQGDWKWDQPEEEKPAGGAQSVGKEKLNIIDQDGYELAKRLRRLGQCVPEISAVDAEGSGDSATKELSKTGVVCRSNSPMKHYVGRRQFFRGMCNRSGVGSRSSTREISIVERVAPKTTISDRGQSDAGTAECQSPDQFRSGRRRLPEGGSRRRSR